MADRLPSDHDAVETRRVDVAQVGRTGRPQVVLPDAVDLDPEEVARVFLDGTRYHAQVETTLEGDRVLRYVADNARLAREREGGNYLAEWFDRTDVEFGGTVHLDAVTDGHAYGLRTPGTRVVYTATEGPADSLADIARDVDG